MIVHFHFHSHPTGVTKSVETIVPALNRYSKASVFGYGIRAPKIGLIALLKLVWSGKELVIHAHRNNEIIFALVLRSLGGRFRLVFTRHSDTAPSGFTCYLMRRADHVVSLNSAMSEILPLRSTIIHHGVNTETFNIQKGKTIPGVLQKKLVIVAGRIRYTKGQLVVIKALAPVLKDTPDWGLVIIGKIDDKKYSEEILSEALKYNITSQVHFLPETDNIAGYYNSASVVIIASLTEGFSLICLEAMACGLITIATDKVGIHTQVIENCRNGFLFPVNDHEALRRIFKDIVDEKVTLNPVKIRETVVENWSIEKSVKELLKLYEISLLNRENISPKIDHTL